ncbi:uncharacterized protein [Nicotiana tomentosiformis]|uniref:uncharacterized protein n=1 Tax=Nicotiana tomentosiformis TaxID=4098 RepID=UPI00388C7B26
MTNKFLDKYFSSAKTSKFRREIHNLCQNDTEIVFEAWERFKEIVRKCQHSEIELWMQLQDFLDGLTPASRRTLSNTIGGSLMKKTPEEIVTILNELSEDANQLSSKIAERRRSTGVHQVDANTSVQVQLNAIANKIRKPTLASIHSEPYATCDICGRGHPTPECQASIEEISAVGNYNFNAMGDPGFVNQPRPQFRPQQPIHPGLEDLMKSFNVKTNERLDAHGSAIKELGTGLRNLEKQVGQIAIVLSERIHVDKKKKGKKGAEKKKKEETSRREESNESEHMPALPFSQKLYREKLDKQFERFLGMLRQVNVNLPFTEVLSQMPAYAKFLKEILTKKRKIEEVSIVKLTEHCSAILQNQLPQKKLENELRDIRSKPISLQLADQTTIILQGIVEDILVWVDKFVFLVDFIVVKMEENKKVPLILGIPFLAMGRAILDIHDRKLMRRVGEETVTFKMNVEMGVRKEKPTASVEWRVKSLKEKVPVIEKDKCGVYPKKAEKKLSAWMYALVRARRM